MLASMWSTMPPVVFRETLQWMQRKPSHGLWMPWIDMEFGDLFLLSMETMLISVTMQIISIIITVIFRKNDEIYLYTSIAPIPFATMTNKEWGNIGNNYLKGLFALAFQGFFIMVCVAIYAVFVSGIAVP